MKPYAAVLLAKIEQRYQEILDKYTNTVSADQQVITEQVKIEKENFEKQVVMEEVLIKLKQDGFKGLEKRNSKGLLPLVHYASEGDTETVIKLLLVGVDPNKKDIGGSTALMFAVTYGTMEMVEQLHAFGAKVDEVDKFNITALTMAARTGLRADSSTSKDMVAWLIKHHANVNSKSKDGFTALMQAALDINLDAIELLLKNGADPNRQTKDGVPALKMLPRNKSSSKAKELLIKYGAKE